MTSKEALKRVKQAHYTAMACLGIENPDIVTEKAIEQIEKDLEMLDTLKSKIRISNDFDVKMLDYPLFLLPMTKEERDKIKEWLGNEK